MNRLASPICLSIVLFSTCTSQLHAEVTLFVDHYNGAMSIVGQGDSVNGIRITSSSGLLNADLGPADPFSTFFDRRPTEIVMGNLSTFVEIDGVVTISPRVNHPEHDYDLTFQYGVGTPPLGDLLDGEIRIVPEPSTNWLFTFAFVFLLRRNAFNAVHSLVTDFTSQTLQRSASSANLALGGRETT